MPNGKGQFPKQGAPPIDPRTEHHMEGFERAMIDALDGWDKDPNTLFTVTFGVKAVKLHNPGGVKEYHVTIGS